MFRGGLTIKAKNKKSEKVKKGNSSLSIKKQELKNHRTKCVYIVLSKTQTIPSDLIKFWTQKPYAHTSLALDINLNEMYSFARKKVNNPLNAGFITEDITKGVFGRDTETTCMVRRLRITEEQWENLVNELEYFKDNRDKFHYNFLGLFSIAFNIAVEKEYRYFCSQFVFKILQSSGVRMHKNKPGLCTPDDFRTWDALETVYEGKLRDYRDFVKEYNIKDNIVPSQKLIDEYNEKCRLNEKPHRHFTRREHKNV